MGLKANAAALAQHKDEARAQKRCKAVRVRELLPAEDRAEYDAMLADLAGDEFSSSEVSDLLRDENITVSASSVAGHRAKRCGCSR